MKKTRLGNEIVLGLFEDAIRKDYYPLIIYEAPTGYGKTSIIPGLYKYSKELGVSTRLIHVAPLRSLVEHVYKHRLLGDMFDELTSLGLSSDDLGYQMMGYGTGKSPYFLRRIITSTVDSFILNLFKLPVAELHKSKAHYEAPRLGIDLSTILLDEAHLYGGDPGIRDTDYMFTIQLSIIKALTYMHVPLIIATATLPKIIIDSIKNITKIANEIKTYHVKVVFDKEPSNGNKRIVLVKDKDFLEPYTSIEWVTEIIRDEEQLIDIVHEAYSSDLRILVVRNTPKKAVDVYVKLKDKLGAENIALVHGLMYEADRLKIIDKLHKVKILVGTQVVEVGLDIDFDILVTDVASPPALIQRAGRIIRRINDRDKGYIYIIEGDGDNIYDKRVVRQVLEYVSVNKDHIDWRLPCSSSYKRSIYELLELVYKRAPRIDTSLFLHLLELHLNLLLGYTSAKKFYKSLCSMGKGFTRSTILVPVYFGPLDSIDYDKVRLYSVPLSIGFLKRVFDKILLRRNGSNMMIIYDFKANDFKIVEIAYNELDKLLSSCGFLTPLRINNSLVLFYALVGDEKVYIKSIGVKL